MKDDAGLDGDAGSMSPNWARFLICVAGLLGLSGVLTAAAGAHAGGGGFARLASMFLMIHAVAVIGIVGVVDRRPGMGVPGFASAILLSIGTTLFSSDLAALAFLGAHPLGWLAPVGGVLMLAGWAVLAVAPFLGR